MNYDAKIWSFPLSSNYKQLGKIVASGVQLNVSSKNCSRGGSNSRPSDYETDALPTELLKQCDIFSVSASI